MEPIPETREALRRLGELDDEDLGRDLEDAAAALGRRVPGLVGFSISVLEQDITFTYLTTAVSLAGLDALQYLGGGPCEEAVGTGAVVAVDHEDLLDEGRWLLFAGASAGCGVASTLSLPILAGPDVVGSVNIYGAAADTFTGRHEELAGLFGAWAPGAVTNADLSFSSRLRAAGAVERLEDLAVVDLAVGVLVAAHTISPVEARHRLDLAAARAGVPVVDVARLLVDVGTGR
ncbi:ANTAR domain-containing protein [Terrabacter sp. 2YAF2]|uniref:ANTAR domain-containing protein n=1 Tax=Terrabacter sp. 2YAF2 TaxID=3233026 RepID=UPI003F9D4E01